MPKEKIGITLENLENWFSGKTKDFYEKTNIRIKEIKHKIKEEISATEENLKILEEAKLKNENIPLKEKQFMEGSRSFYIKKIRLFINSLDISDEDLIGFAEGMKKRIDELGSSTLRSYQILQHFFEHEAYGLAQNIKRVDTLCRDLESSIKSREIIAIESIKDSIKNLNSSISKKENLKKSIKEKESIIENLEKEKTKISSEIARKQQSNEFKDYYRLEVEQYRLKEDVEELKSEFLHYFSVLEHSLKKHLKISFEDENLLARYIENPISALLDDKNLELISILKKVENNIIKEVIDLKDKKKGKTLEVINQINHEKINPFLDEYKKLTQKLKEVSEKMLSYSVLDEIDKIKKRLDEKTVEIEKAKKDAENMTQDILKIEINQLKKELKEKIDDFLNVDLSLD
jgi:hypothetical protein